METETLSFNPDRISACQALIVQHFSQYGQLPIAFEHDGENIGFDTYTKFFTDIELDAMMGKEYGDHGLYPLPDTSINSGENFRLWTFADTHFVPTYHQWRLHRAAKKALDQGLFYFSDVYALVVREMRDLVSEELLALNHTRMAVEYGRFGSEIFRMWDIVKAHAETELNTRVLKDLKSRHNFRIGMKIKGPFNWGSDTFSSLVVAGIRELEGIVRMEAKKRGSRNTWTFSLGAAHERMLSHMENQANKLYATEK